MRFWDDYQPEVCAVRRKKQLPRLPPRADGKRETHQSFNAEEEAFSSINLLLLG
jgi:hypothetical protein